MGRAGLEPATLGLKVLHIDGKPNLKKRRFEPLSKPLHTAREWLWIAASCRHEPNVSRFALHLRDSS